MGELYGFGNYERVDDLGDNYFLNQAGGLANAKAKYAGNSQRLSYVSETTNVSTLLFDVTGNGILSGNNFVLLPTTNLPEFFRFALQSPISTGPTFSSDRNLNEGTKKIDHMVSFRLGNGNLVIAFEDLFSTNWDADYNDLVVEVEFVTLPPQLTEVPEPASFALFGLSALGLVFSRRKRRKASPAA